MDSETGNGLPFVCDSGRPMSGAVSTGGLESSYGSTDI